MLLVFDVGNTNMVLGLYKGKELIKYWRITTDKYKTSDEYGILISNLFQYENIDMNCVEDVIISSVVPDVMHSLENFCKKYCKKEPKVVGPGIKTGLNIKYDNPKQVGADRIVNAVACVEKYGTPVLVVDFGTATTFCAITNNAEYLGGTIAPGIKISSEALFQRASKLPRVELVKPGTVTCKNTVSDMQAGAGHACRADSVSVVPSLLQWCAKRYRRAGNNGNIRAKQPFRPCYTCLLDGGNGRGNAYLRRKSKAGKAEKRRY